MIYEIRAKIVQNRWLKADHEFIAVLNVKEHADLMRLCMEPRLFDKATRVHFLFFNFGSINMACNMPQTGFFPGDTIPISVHIENLTTKIIHIRAYLRRKDMFTAYHAYHARQIGKRMKKKQFPFLVSPPIQAGEITSF